uniref:Uncharacterized protein LOC113794732 n=1 Tax=Dermatophagoides pteronyssinus TaxID=6956 RepID=A0A6P6Y5A8_DERPT|nr:uncharacterized protein LOC113794732 [Dermatophagoides pteronyssinus]
MKQIKIELENTKEEHRQQMLQNQQELEQLKQTNESLLIQVKSVDTLNSMYDTMQKQLQKINDNKEKEFKNKLDEKDKIIADQQARIHEYVEKVKLIQMEKDKVLRSFHDKVLDSMKQSSSISVSAVTPITNQAGYKIFPKTSTKRLNDENENTTAFDNQQCQENYEKTLDTVIISKDQQVENTMDFQLPQSSSSYSIVKSKKSNNTIDANSDDDIFKNIVTTSINEPVPKSKPISNIAPISAKLAEHDADKAQIITDSINKLPDNDCEKNKSKIESTNIVGILKRKNSVRNDSIDSKTRNNLSNDNKTKKIRFSGDVVDNEKQSTTKASKLPTYRARKKSLIDISYVKSNSNEKMKSTNSKNKRKSKLFDDDSESSPDWVDDVFTFP